MPAPISMRVRLAVTKAASLCLTFRAIALRTLALPPSICPLLIMSESSDPGYWEKLRLGLLAVISVDMSGGGGGGTLRAWHRGHGDVTTHAKTLVCAHMLSRARKVVMAATTRRQRRPRERRVPHVRGAHARA